MREFEDQIDWFRELVLNAPEFEIKRWDGPLTGELGLKTKAACGYVRLRSALPGFVVEVSRQTGFVGSARIHLSVAGPGPLLHPFWAPVLGDGREG